MSNRAEHPDSTPDTAKDPATADDVDRGGQDSDRSDGVLDDAQEPSDTGR